MKHGSKVLSLETFYITISNYHFVPVSVVLEFSRHTKKKTLYVKCYMYRDLSYSSESKK